MKRAVDIGGVEMVIEEKAKKEEVKVDVVKEKPAEPQVNNDKRLTTKKGKNSLFLEDTSFPLSSSFSSIVL